MNLSQNLLTKMSRKKDEATNLVNELNVVVELRDGTIGFIRGNMMYTGKTVRTVSTRSIRKIYIDKKKVAELSEKPVVSGLFKEIRDFS